MNLRKIQSLNRRVRVRRLADLSHAQESAMPAAWWLLRAMEERRTLSDRRATRQPKHNETH
jgi:hypothetical protein